MRRSAILAILFCWISHAQSQQPIRVNVGGPALTDKYGISWNADTCTGDSIMGIAGTYSRPIYSSAGFNTKESIPIECDFKVIPGVYNITLHLNEPFLVNNAPRKRVFDILLNGQPLVSGVDIFVRCGAVRADCMLIVPVRIDSQLNLTFVSRTNPAMIAAIEITQLFEFNATTPPLWFIPPGGAPIPLSSISFNGDAVIAYGEGSVQIGFNTAVLAKRDAMQSGPASPLTSGNPQTCAPQPLGNTLTPGIDYVSTCSTPLTHLDRYQVLNWIVETPNAGPVSLSIETFPAMPVLDAKGNPLAPGALYPRLWHIWNDGAAWKISDAI